MPFMSPGGAFSEGFLNQMLTSETQARQAALDAEQKRRNDAADQMAMQRERRIAANEALERAQADEALTRQRDEAEQRNRDRKLSNFEKRVGQMVAGDVPDAAMVEEADRLGQGHLFQLDPNSGIRSYLGSPKEILEKRKRDDILKYALTLPEGSPLRTGLEFTGRTGEQPPAGMFTGTKQMPLVRIGRGATPIVKQFDETTQQWMPLAGPIPQGANISHEEAPQTSGDNAAAQRLVTVHNNAVVEMNKIAAPLEGSMKDFDRLGISLKQNTAQADADIAPLILKATVGGEGSGFRMTRAEIENTLKGRTKWEDLQATLSRWSSDPQHTTIPPEQREAMRTLGKAIRDKSYTMRKMVLDYRRQIDEAEDPKAIWKLTTEMRDKLYPEESELDQVKSGVDRTDPAAAAKALIEAARGGRGGKK